MQTVKRSWAEAWSNIAIGFGINFMANMIILPLFGFATLTPGKNFILGLLYTLISLLRSFCLRRWFNKNDDVGHRLVLKSRQASKIRRKYGRYNIMPE